MLLHIIHHHAEGYMLLYLIYAASLWTSSEERPKSTAVMYIFWDTRLGSVRLVEK